MCPFHLNAHSIRSISSLLQLGILKAKYPLSKRDSGRDVIQSFFEKVFPVPGLTDPLGLVMFSLSLGSIERFQEVLITLLIPE